MLWYNISLTLMMFSNYTISAYPQVGRSRLVESRKMERVVITSRM